jgi:hypothetical protein
VIREPALTLVERLATKPSALHPDEERSTGDPRIRGSGDDGERQDEGAESGAPAPRPQRQEDRRDSARDEDDGEAHPDVRCKRAQEDHQEPPSNPH